MRRDGDHRPSVVTLAFVALVVAWLAEGTDSEIASLSQQNPFNNAIVLALLKIGSMVGVFRQARKL